MTRATHLTRQHEDMLSARVYGSISTTSRRLTSIAICFRASRSIWSRGDRKGIGGWVGKIVAVAKKQGASHKD